LLVFWLLIYFISIFFISKSKKGFTAQTQKIPFPGLYDRKSIFDSRASILMLRQFHSFPYSGELYIFSSKKRSKTNDIFHLFVFSKVICLIFVSTTSFQWIYQRME